MFSNSNTRLLYAFHTAEFWLNHQTFTPSTYLSILIYFGLLVLMTLQTILTPTACSLTFYSYAGVYSVNSYIRTEKLKI
jgi:hypothetical protein